MATNKAKVHKVLVKDVWKGLIEMYLEPDDETIDKFADENGVLYAVTSYQDGIPSYTLMKKKLWDKMDDEVAEVMLDSEMSEDDKIEKLKKLAED